MKNNVDLSHLKWALDYEEDLKLIREIIKKISKNPIHMKDILELFDKEPNLPQINKDNPTPPERYQQCLEEDEKFLGKNQ